MMASQQLIPNELMNCQAACSEVVFQDRLGFVELRAVINFTIAPFIPAGIFVRSNPCNVNIRMCPVLFCSHIGNLSAVTEIKWLIHQRHYQISE